MYQSLRSINELRACPEFDNNGTLTTVHDLKVPKHLQHLYRHLLENGYIRNLDTVDLNYLAIHADVVLENIRGGDNAWQTQVPQTVVNIINERDLFRQRD